MKLVKRMKKAYDGLSTTVSSNVSNGVAQIKARSTVKFDETVEIALNLNIDTRKPDQKVRGMISLPHGTGKTVRVAVFARNEKAVEAKQAGADIVGAEELVEMIQKGQINFDRCIATPDMMVIVGKIGKELGTKGLMPNPKLGTVTLNVAEAVKLAKAGQIEYRAEKAGVVHAPVGKISFDESALIDNVKALVTTIIKARPSGAKGSFIKSIYLSSTMGPSIQLDANEFHV